MKTRPFKQVDVFTDTPYLGNPLAVVLDGTGLSDEEMQHFAQWTNLSETTFVLPPSAEAAAAGADYQLRIFTTAYEMPFAGHPTLGSCHAWLEHGGAPKQSELIVQQCKVGLVRIRRNATQLAFAAPALTRSAVAQDVVTELLAALGLRAPQLSASQHLVNGPRYIGLLLDHTDTMLAVQPELVALRAAMVRAGISGIGLAARVAPSTENGLIKRSNREARALVGHPNSRVDTTQAQLTVRFFANDVMVIEDPVTGSFNASLAQWLIADGLAPRSYIAAQGCCLGRAGRVHIAQDSSGQVWVGGDSVTCIDGTVNL